ncbi:hypothetical protein EK21DRAFT_87515 [Setomelanomma holmii]|uniref:Uncharacterized protein n=1 Tax=Setomelanomma holmii TaxID=210430 RepID=A0A9P4HEG7_9PLEO|nr:hypothetical protein EK21DRAFT_87515 [Setomelanomma holmii]
MAAPATPLRTPGKKSAPSTPSTPKTPSAHRVPTPGTPNSPLRAPSARREPASKSRPAPTPTSSRKTFTKKPFLPPSKRRAALAAEDKIHGYFEDTEEFLTECAIEDADQLEEARLPEDMRRMSITPSPFSHPQHDNMDPNGEVGTEDSVEILVNDEPDYLHTIDTSTPTSTSQHATQPNPSYDWTSWTQDRLNGDRHLSKYQARCETADEESDLDISRLHLVNGVLVYEDEAGELDLTGEM